MKIAVMTWFHHDRYGSLLQADALCQVLRSAGHEADIIDYFPGSGCLRLPARNRRREVVLRMRSARWDENDPVITTQVSGEAFARYRREHLHMTPYCSTLTDLENLNETYDAFVCGSDRIWLPIYFDPHYYLDFVRDPDRMIAYAPSIFDTGETDRHVRSRMEQLISRFRHLSVREGEGRKYLDAVFGEKTQELADPILLIEPEDWDTSLQLPGGGDEHYLLASFEGRNPSYWDAAAHLAARLGLRLRIVPVHRSDLDREGAITGEISPRQYIAWIRNAEYVCTDSYHGTLLALQYQKEFCCFERYTDRELLPLNTRVRHILDAVGLSSRLYDRDASMERYLEKTDYIPVNYKLDALKLRSREFLQDALRQVEAYASGAQPRKRHILEGFTLCSGCGACAAVCRQNAIEITLSPEGAWRASVNESLCEKCEQCRAVCPFQKETTGKVVAESRLLSYQDEDPLVRGRASAGGLGARLALILKKQGYAVAGCLFDEAAQIARHEVVFPDQKDEALARFQGSKYLPSRFGDIWTQLKDWSGPLAVFGTPCQIAGARRVFWDRKNVIYIEINCGGVPTYLLFEKYKASFRGRNRMDPQTFDLSVRYKQVPQQGRYIRIRDESQEKVITRRKDLFCRVMDSGEYFCEACYDCRWQDQSEADLRIGDMPAGPYPDPDREPEESFCMCMSTRGKQLLDTLMTEGYWEGLHKRDIVAYLTAHPGVNPPRPVFYEELTQQMASEKTSLQRIVHDYVRVLEKRRIWQQGGLPFYPG